MNESDLFWGNHLTQSMYGCQRQSRINRWKRPAKRKRRRGKSGRTIPAWVYFLFREETVLIFPSFYCCCHSAGEGRSGNSSHNNASAHEAKARTDCNESNQSKDCSVAVKSQQRIQSGTAAGTAGTAATAGNHKLRQAQQQQPHHHKSAPALRRKAAVTKKQPPAKSTSAATPKPQQQVINRARGTLHGLSTIKRHGNVRVT